MFFLHSLWVQIWWVKHFTQVDDWLELAIVGCFFFQVKTLQYSSVICSTAGGTQLGLWPGLADLRHGLPQGEPPKSLVIKNRVKSVHLFHFIPGWVITPLTQTQLFSGIGVKNTSNDRFCAHLVLWGRQKVFEPWWNCTRSMCHIWSSAMICYWEFQRQQLQLRSSKCVQSNVWPSVNAKTEGLSKTTPLKVSIF